MNDCLLDNWNSVVKEGDKGYWLGDVALQVPRQDEFDTFLQRFNGTHALYLGNHDNLRQHAYRRFRYIELWSGGKFAKHGFVCSHIPLRPDQMRGSEFNVHGHIHQNTVYKSVARFSDLLKCVVEDVEPDPHYLNVCVEQTNYKPVELDDIIARIEQSRKELEVPA
jgi:calcineurin-like phosphoesterase family protein